MEKTLREKVAAKLSQIKKVLAEEETPEAEVQLEDVKKVDGTILRIEPAIEIGATVQVIGEDAELIEAPEGEHELENGDVIKVEGGIIVEIMLAEGEPEAVVEEEMSEEAPVAEPKSTTLDIEALQNQLIEKLNTSISDKINNLKFANVETVDAIKKENEVLRQSLTDLVDIVEKFAGTPSEEPKKKPYNPYANTEKKPFDFSKLRKPITK